MSDYSPKPIEDEGALTASLLYLPRKFSAFYSSASSREGGSSILRPVALTYCALLSIETLFVSTPLLTRRAGFDLGPQLAAENMRFVYKPFVDDGADMGRLLPYTVSPTGLLSKLPLVPGDRPIFQSTNSPLWANPGTFAMCVFIAIMIQRFEALAWRRQSVERTRKEFDKYDRIKTVTAAKDSVAVAKLKAAQHNNYGSGDTAIRFTVMSILYFLEGGAFLSSFAPGSALWAQVTYGFLTIFGYEIFDRILSEDEEN